MFKKIWRQTSELKINKTPFDSARRALQNEYHIMGFYPKTRNKRTRPTHKKRGFDPQSLWIFFHKFKFQYSYKIWNNFPHHVENTPSFLANDIPLPSESEFFDDTNMGMRPISPGSGQEFSVALGGNRPREQFTSRHPSHHFLKLTHNSIF